MHTFISVIICTFNSGDKIIDCINSLKNQNYPKNKYEIIVVNDGSNDDTKDTLKKINSHVIHNIRNLGLAESRNVGFKSSKGKIIAFTDDDCIPNSNWLITINEVMNANKNAIGISGKVNSFEIKNYIQEYISLTNPLSPLPVNLTYSTNAFYRLILYLKNQLSGNNKLTKELSSVVGANMAFRKNILKKLNGFDSNFIFGSEEEELCYRLIKQYGSSKILLYSEKMVVKHKFEASLKKFIKRNFKYGIGNCRLKKKYSERSLTIFPFPVIEILFLIITFVFKINILFIFLLPFFLYFSWIIRSIKYQKTHLIFFAYLQLIQELAYNLGWFKYYLYK